MDAVVETAHPAADQGGLANAIGATEEDWGAERGGVVEVAAE
jgi:hypothetical protein